MPQIRKILFPVDFSESCVGTARFVEAMAGRFEAKITLLHVSGLGEHNTAEDLRGARQHQLDQFLQDELKYFDVERLCVTGEPEVEIERVARESDTDLVMMPTHGLGIFRLLLIGSVTARVLHDLQCPVWTGLHTKNAPPLEGIHCRRILCALDLSERSRGVLEWAVWLAREYGAELAVVHALPPMPPEDYGWCVPQEYAVRTFRQAQEQVEGLQAATGAAGRVFLNTGDPATIVTRAAHEYGAELLVMGRHSGSGLAGYLRRHSYSIIRDSPCPVISI